MSQQPADILASDPLRQVTRHEKQALLAVSAISLVVAESGLVPSRISALGVEFDPADQRVFLVALAGLVAYFLLAFAIYAAQDFSVWRLAFFRAVDEASRSQPTASDEAIRVRKHLWIQAIRRLGIMRGSLEFIVPILVAVAALGALLRTAPPQKLQAPPTQQAPLQSSRADNFGTKERCAIAAERIDKHFKDGIAEVFYSSKRNSCVCEVASLEKNNSLHTLLDCLTRETIADGFFTIGASDLQQRLDEWQHKKDALR